MLSVTVPLPLPLSGDAVTQPALEDAIHEHAAVVTVMVALPPPIGADTVAGDTA
jgi:hypothetical protein